MLPGKSSILCFYSKCKPLKINEINPYFIIAVSFAIYWLSTDFMALYAL